MKKCKYSEKNDENCSKTGKRNRAVWSVIEPEKRYENIIKNE